LGSLQSKAAGNQLLSVVEASPEKAGVGGSIPFLACMFSITHIRPKAQFCPKPNLA
jgi:hypothetical protein